MSDEYQPPAKDTPIALRLAPFVTGFTVEDLVQLLTEPTDYCERSDFFFLHAYQWVRDGVFHEKPSSAIKIILKPALEATSLHEAIAATPPDIFVFSQVIEDCKIVLGTVNEPRPPYHERPDWHPTITGFEELIAECPEPLRTICSLWSTPRHKSRDEAKRETEDRNRRLQKLCDKIHKNNNSLKKKEIAGEIHKRIDRDPEFKENPRFNRLSTAAIERIIRVKSPAS